MAETGDSLYCCSAENENCEACADVGSSRRELVVEGCGGSTWRRGRVRAVDRSVAGALASFGFSLVGPYR